MARAPVTPRAEHRFVIVWTALALFVLVLGFIPSWFLRFVVESPPGRPLTPFVALHGALFTSWMLFFGAQVWFAARGRLKIHMALGRIAPAYVAVLFVTAIAVALYGAARSDTDGPIPPDVFLLLPICEAVGFAGFALWAWFKRGEPFLHKRLMLFSMAVILGTATGRMFGGVIGTFVLPLPFIFAIWIFDWRNARRIDRRVLAAGFLALACYAVPLALGFTEGWRTMAGQMIDWWSATFG